MVEFMVRPAARTDERRIREVVRRAGISLSNLDPVGFVVAELPAGQIIGCGQLSSHDDGSLSLASVAVDGPYRRQGVARAIVERLLSTGARPVYLICRPELGPFYEKFGFHAIEPDEMPPHYLRVHRFLHTVRFLAGPRAGGLVMALD